MPRNILPLSLSVDRMLRCGKPPANGKRWKVREREREGGGRGDRGGRRIQLKKYDITCARERERERMGGGTV